MNGIFCKISLLVCLFFFGISPILAQSKFVTAVPSGKVIEINLRASKPPARVALSSREPHGLWTSAIDRIKEWKLPEGALPIQAVNFQAKLVGDKAEVRVSVFSGKRFRENDILIATHTIGEGETTIITELAKYGVAPVRIKMFNVQPVIANVPVVINKSQSIRTEISPSVSTLPSFFARLTNTSSKHIAAIVWNTRLGEKKLVSAIPQAPYSKPLILPNGVFEMTVPADNPDGSLHNITLTIEAVIFDDGSFEGDAQSAADFRSYVYGRRDALTKILKVLRTYVSAAPARPNIAELIDKIDAQKPGITDESLSAFLNEYPDASNFKPSIDGRLRAASDTVNNEVIGVLRNLKTAAVGRADDDLNQKLSAYVEHLQEWLERLSKR